MGSAEPAHPSPLDRASQRLAAIVESSDDAIVSKNLDGVIESWNAGAERMFGYSASEAIGRSILLIVPADRRHEEDEVLAGIRRGEPVEMETVRQRKDGSRIDISLKVSPLKDAQGRIVGASKIARDITARKRAEAERAELQRRLALLVTVSASLLESPQTASVRSATVSIAQQLIPADGYAVWVSGGSDARWRIASSEGVSAAFANRLIATHAGTKGPPRPPFTSPLAVADVSAEPLVAEQLNAYRDEGIVSMLVCPMRLGAARAGTLVFYYRAPHVFSEAEVQTGQALANLASAALTTAALYDEQRAQRDAAESARRHAAFLADAAAILSRSLDYEQTLAAVARLAVPEIADWCAIDMIDREGRLERLALAHVQQDTVEYERRPEGYRIDPNGPAGVHEVIRTGKPALLRSIGADVAGGTRNHDDQGVVGGLDVRSYICVPIISASGVFGAMSFIFAASGRHYTDADLAIVQDLAARAALALDNAFAYRRAHDANRVKDEFLATLSHELRTPLNAILGYAQMLNMGVLSPERQANAVMVLTRNAEALRQIIDDVLDVSRITSGKLRLTVRRVDLRDVVRNALATIQPAADAKGVSLELTVEARTWLVSGDPDRLQQVFWNLLTNAVKFTPPGGHVRLELHDVESSVQIQVSDDGHGIDPHFLPYIFEPFRQADSRFSREHGGLGLGLAIVRELVELHGGSVSATSDGPGRGATFSVRLPALIIPDESPDTTPHDRSGARVRM